MTTNHDHDVLWSIGDWGEFIGNMADYPVFEFGSNELVRVGKALTKPIPFETAEDRDAAIHIFKVAYSWRDSHAYPTRRIRHELLSNVRRGKKSGLTASRLKRMDSIKRKLAYSSTKLNQMQDLGGCRAIMNSISEVEAMVNLYRSGGTVHTVRTDTDYIAAPRNSGYRGHHFVLEFRPTASGEDVFAGRRIEVQIRTRLQHCWSTAVEAIGTARGEELKSGRGDKDWLRFFTLMASEIAAEEGCHLVPGTHQDSTTRISELRDLDRKLGAATFLENINDAFDVSSTIRDKHAKFFLIQIDNRRKVITVESFGWIGAATGAYSSQEHSNSEINTVLVEVDKVGSLKEAYPNYFMDVGLFAERVRKALGHPTRDEKPKALNLSWLRSYIGKKKPK